MTDRGEALETAADVCELSRRGRYTSDVRFGVRVGKADIVAALRALEDLGYVCVRAVPTDGMVREGVGALIEGAGTLDQERNIYRDMISHPDARLLPPERE